MLLGVPRSALLRLSSALYRWLEGCSPAGFQDSSARLILNLRCPSESFPRTCSFSHPRFQFCSFEPFF